MPVLRAGDPQLVTAVVDEVEAAGYTSLHTLLRNPTTRDWLASEGKIDGDKRECRTPTILLPYTATV